MFHLVAHFPHIPHILSSVHRSSHPPPLRHKWRTNFLLFYPLSSPPLPATTIPYPSMLQPTHLGPFLNFALTP